MSPYSITTEQRPIKTRSEIANRARTERRKSHTLEFIGVDGEGITIRHDDGRLEHRYVMLSIGDRTLYDYDGLSHERIFAFLYSCFESNRNAVYVGFYLAYDFTMWLKSLTQDRARMLFTSEGIAVRKRQTVNPVPFPVYVDGWEIDMLGFKRFKIRPHVPEYVKPLPWMYICDTGAFFQSSFLTVIDPKNWTEPICTPEEYTTVREGKEHRAEQYELGDESFYPDMVRYNRLENELLARALVILNEGFVSAGIFLARDAWYGPGQAVQKWLDKKVKRDGQFLHHKQIAETVPAWVLDAFRKAYYGGHFELYQHGYIPGPAYEYDIQSAYPHVMRSLPCLCSLSWHQTPDDETHPDAILKLSHISYQSRGAIGPLPFRNNKGNILYPSNGKGWYLDEEWNTAQSAGLLTDVTVHERIYALKRCEHDSPLAEMAELFLQRLRVGKKTPLGKALKLLLNSAYGKTAQSIGTPKYGNPIYASMITALTRKMILGAIGTHPNAERDLLMVATDGIYFRTPHPILDEIAERGEQLGGWERATKRNMSLFKPGVYWDDKAREHGASAIKSRGINARALADNMLRIDEAFQTILAGESFDWPKISIPVPFSVISPMLALARNDWSQSGNVSWNAERIDTASCEPKRTEPYIQRGVIRTRPLALNPDTESAPYKKLFGFDDELREEWGITPDGYVTDIVGQTIRELL